MQRSAFDLTRMHRLVAKFRALIADACYGTVLGDNDAGAAAGDTILVEVGGTQVEVEIPDAVEQGQVFTVRVALDAEPGAVEPEAEESGFPWNSEDMQMRLASEEESSDSDGDFASEFKTRERSAPADQQETQHTLQQSMFGDAKKRSRKEDSIEKAQKKDSFARARSRK